VLAVAVGIYLPIELSVPIFIGGMIAWGAARALAGSSADIRAKAGRRGLLFASGLITGEALVGILLAIPFAAAQSNKVLQLPLGESWSTPAEIIGVVAFVGFCVWLYKVASKR
jgi:uncharacterized oligopeptide transporter (OPT) family protein